MLNKSKAFVKETAFLKKYLYAIPAFLIFVLLFHFFPPSGIDWRLGFYEVAKKTLSPYDVKLFINPPWIGFLLFPFRYFSEISSLAINTSLNLVLIGVLVIARKGSKLSVILTITSFPVLSMIANGNIEWIFALGFILQNRWSTPLLLLKPQVGLLAILSWSSFWNNKLSFFIPTLIIILISFVVWGNWLSDMLTNIQNMQNAQQGLSSWNASLFPWSIPIGLILIYVILKYNPIDAEIFGVIATLCIVPYFAIYSTGILFALISASHKRIAIIMWVLLWAYPFLQHH
jgi:flagellar biosynthesis protein FliQ